MERFISLQSSLNRLYQAEDDRQAQNKCGYPEGIPLHALPTVIVPLLDCLWLRVIEDLLQNDESVPPKLEVVNLAVLRTKLSVPCSSWIQTALPLLLLKPPYGFFLILREKEANRAKSLVEKCFWEDGTFSLI